MSEVTLLPPQIYKVYQACKDQGHLTLNETYGFIEGFDEETVRSNLALWFIAAKEGVPIKGVENFKDLEGCYNAFLLHVKDVPVAKKREGSVFSFVTKILTKIVIAEQQHKPSDFLIAELRELEATGSELPFFKRMFFNLFCGGAVPLGPPKNLFHAVALVIWLKHFEKDQNYVFRSVIKTLGRVCHP
jgi:hypothetical protein